MRSIAFVWGVIASILLSFYPGIQDAKKRIDTYERAGRYDQALDIARETQKKLLNSNTDKANNLSLTIVELEEKLLHLGYAGIFFSQDGKPQPKFCQLLQILGIQQPSKKSIEEISAWAQANLLDSVVLSYFFIFR